MKNYLSALKYCYENGDFVKSRAGNVKKAFGYQMRFDLEKGLFGDRFFIPTTPPIYSQFFSI